MQGLQVGAGEHPFKGSEDKSWKKIWTLTQIHSKIWFYNTALAKWELNGWTKQFGKMITVFYWNDAILWTIKLIRPVARERNIK